MSVSEYLVVDSGGFIKNAPIKDYTDNVVSLQSVVSEIVDKETKKRLQVLPYEIAFKEPSNEDLQHVTEFAKKTGDYGSLSLTDLKVLAVTYMLEKQLVGTDHLRTEPEVKKTTNFYKPQSNGGTQPGDAALPGFYAPDEESGSEDEDSRAESNTSEHDGDDSPQMSSEDAKEPEPEVSIEDLTISNEESNTESLPDEESTEDESTDDEGWITPGNIQSKRFGGNTSAMAKKVAVACLTTDFAMQNVLKQMGLNVISVNGLLIHETRTWILRCYMCFKTTPQMHRVFCPKCGNKTLKRVSVTLNEDGTQQIHISTRKPLSRKGKKFSLPAPKGGKHGVNPILSEDQPQPQMRMSKKAREKLNAMDPDFVAGNSPFSMRDVTSRSALIGVPGKGQMGNKYWLRKNPNAVPHKTGNRKKKQ